MAGEGTNWHMATGLAVGAVHGGEQQARVARVEETPEHHGEAPLLFAPAALGHELGHVRGVPGSRWAGSKKRTV